MSEPDVKYPHNPLEGFANGCLLDLRVRMALQILTHSPMYAIVSPPPPEHSEIVATHALDVATALLALAESRGLVDPIPDDDGELSPALRAQARRTGSFTILQQVEAQKFAQREADQVIPAAPRMVNPSKH